jgi:hypothetical protein
MPRAEPKRSAYCSSRHLLRNLEDARELRRNPLTQSYFASHQTLRRDRQTENAVLERIRARVHRALAHFGPDPGARRAHADLGRMHAALLRCEIDREPLAVVAAELSLSERQLRRERRAAHDAFFQAFADDAGTATPATASPDLAVLRLTEAVELHELGQTRLAQSACARLVAAAPRCEQRLEALCLAAEIDLDALQCNAAGAHLAEARALITLRACELDVAVASAAAERIDFVEWLLRWRSGASVGVASPPPEIATPAGVTRERDEPGRALLVRALAAYAQQRWEVGDIARGREATRRANAVALSLGPTRAKERFALMYADARLDGLREPPRADGSGLVELERLAHAKGHLRTLLSARAERIGSTVQTERGERIFHTVLAPFNAAERGSMTAALAAAALIVAQCERDPRHARAAADLAERLVPARSATALLARSSRASRDLEKRRYDEAWPLLQAIHDDAELVGNARVRGAAGRHLATVALLQRRRRTAHRCIDWALPLLVHYGTRHALAQAGEIARRLHL